MQNDGLSPRVIRYTHAVLSSALKQAVKWEMIFRNPAAMVDLPRQARKEMRAMTPDEAAKFLGAVKNTRMSALFIFALTTGMRPQEYLALKWSDVNLNKGTATVRRAIVWSQKKCVGWHFDEPKTSRSRRTIPLPASTVKALMEHRRRQGEERLRVGSEWQDNGLVFATKFGNAIDIPTLTKQWFKPALIKAELPLFRLYDLRHTPRHSVALKWRESESGIRAFRTFNYRADAGYLFSRFAGHAERSRETNRKILFHRAG